MTERLPARLFYRGARFVLDGTLAVTTTTIVRLRRRLTLALAFTPRRSDIYIVTYPKAGTTVLQMLLYQLTTEGNLDIGHIDAVAPWLEIALGQNPERLDQMPAPRVFKTHLTLDQLPRVGRFIYVVRNPVDTCVSYFHHQRSIQGDGSTLSAFSERFLRGSLPMGSWFEHFERCMRTSTRGVLALNYDEICEDLPGVLDRVATFCELPVSPGQRQRALARCNIEFMRRHNALFDPRLRTQRADSTPFIRAGQPGEGELALTPQEVRQVQERLTSTLNRLGRDQSKALRLLACTPPGANRRAPQSPKPRIDKSG